MEESTETTSVVPPVVAAQVALGWLEATCGDPMRGCGCLKKLDMAMSDMKFIHVYACGPKTVPVKRTFLNIAIVGWGGVGGHVNVPCTSYMIYCHAAKISGIAYYVTCCYAAEISGIVYYIHKNADCQLITAHALQR